MTDEQYVARAVKALESIADSLVKLAHQSQSVAPEQSLILPTAIFPPGTFKLETD